MGTTRANPRSPRAHAQKRSVPHQVSFPTKKRPELIESCQRRLRTPGQVSKRKLPFRTSSPSARRAVTAEIHTTAKHMVTPIVFCAALVVSAKGMANKQEFKCSAKGGRKRTEGTLLRPTISRGGRDWRHVFFAATLARLLPPNLELDLNSNREKTAKVSFESTCCKNCPELRPRSCVRRLGRVVSSSCMSSPSSMYAWGTEFGAAASCWQAQPSGGNTVSIPF